jgi:hypothetical protein
MSAAWRLGRRGEITSISSGIRTSPSQSLHSRVHKDEVKYQEGRYKYPDKGDEIIGISLSFLCMCNAGNQLFVGNSAQSKKDLNRLWTDFIACPEEAIAHSIRDLDYS